MSDLEPEIRDHVGRDVAGQPFVRDLDARLWPGTSDIEQMDDPVATNLTYEIMLRFTEFAKGGRTEGELNELLRPIAESIVIVAG